MNDRERRIARARLLRRDGKTYDEIRAVIGPVDDSTIRTWCKGIPRPASTFRSCPKTDLRRRCRELRRLGYTYTEIAELTGATAGSISPWVRDIKPVSRERADQRRLAAVRAATVTKSKSRQRKRETHMRAAAASIGPLNDRDLFLIGVGLYWAEGAKSKPYAIREHLTFINSDPQMIELFMAWLRLVGVQSDTCRFRVQIHESADVEGAEEYWARLIGIPRSAMSKTTLKRHQPRPTD
jgi:transposase